MIVSRQKRYSWVTPLTAVGLVVVFAACCSCAADEPKNEQRAFTGGVWAGSSDLAMRISEKEFQQILDEPQIVYWFNQVGVTSPQTWSGQLSLAQVRDRARRLREAGKKLVLQLWYGPDGKFNWSFYSFCHIAQNPVVRQKFFREAVDPTIEVFGAENIYAIHLLEETSGTTFGFDILEPGDWRKNAEGIVSGRTSESSYGRRPWLIGRDKSKYDGPWMPNVQEYCNKMLRETGVDMTKADEWGSDEWFVFRRWSARSLLAQAHVELAKHIHQKYPGMKVFSWDYAAMARDKYTDLGYERDYIDGVVLDPYSDAATNFATIRANRTLLRDKEVLAVLWGNSPPPRWRPHYGRGTDPDEKMPDSWIRRQVAVAYAGGANTVGFFNHPSDGDMLGEVFAKQAEIIGELIKQQPTVQTASSKILVISDWYYQPAGALFAPLGYVDVTSTMDSYALDFANYDLIAVYSGNRSQFSLGKANYFRDKYDVADPIDIDGLNEFVTSGGALLLIGTGISQDSDFLLAKNRDLFVGQGVSDLAPWHEDAPPQQWEGNGAIQIRPSGQWQKRFELRDSYQLDYCNRVETAPTNESGKLVTDACYMRGYGQGLVAYCPYVFHDSYPMYDKSQPPSGLRSLVVDLCRGLLIAVGKADVAAQYVVSPADSYGYLRVPVEAQTKLLCVDLGREPLSLPLSGRDLWLGTLRPVLGRDQAVALMPRLSKQ